MTISRRKFLSGAGALLVVAPAVIRTPGLLMPVKAVDSDGLIQIIVNYQPPRLRTWTLTIEEFRLIQQKLDGPMQPLGVIHLPVRFAA